MGKARDRRAHWERVLAEDQGLVPSTPGPRRQEAHAHPKGKPGHGDPGAVELPNPWKGMRTRDLKGKFRFYARLRDFDYQCPRCQELYLVRHRRRRTVVFSGSRLVGGGTWDPVLSRMTCRVCGLVCVLGITASSAALGKPSPPLDAIPTVEEALRVRQARMGGEWEPSRVVGKGAVVNRFVRKALDEGE